MSELSKKKISESKINLYASEKGKETIKKMSETKYNGIDSEKIKKLYVNENKNLMQTHKITGYSVGAIRRSLIKDGIQLKTHKEAFELHIISPEAKNRMLMIGNKNGNYGKPQPEERKIKNIAVHRTEKQLRISSENHIGEKCTFWQGGISFEPYTTDFNARFKERIRDRDDYFCKLCNKPEELCNRRLVVHHCDYDKKSSLPQNCISLCRNCHAMTNLNRKFWTSFFQAMMADYYGYQYTPEGKIIIEIKE